MASPPTQFLVSQRLVAWLLLALIALMGITPPGGLAMCVGEDGHIDLGAGGFGVEQVCLCDSGGEAGDEHGQEEHPSCSDLELEALLMQRRHLCSASLQLADVFLQVDLPLITPGIASVEAPLLERRLIRDEFVSQPSSGWLGALRSNVLIL